MWVNGDEPAVNEIVHEDRSEGDDERNDQRIILEIACYEVGSREDADGEKQEHDREVAAHESRSQVDWSAVLKDGVGDDSRVGYLGRAGYHDRKIDPAVFRNEHAVVRKSMCVEVRCHLTDDAHILTVAVDPGWTVYVVKTQIQSIDRRVTNKWVDISNGVSLISVDGVCLVAYRAFGAVPFRVVFEIVPAAPAVRDAYIFGMGHVAVERIESGRCLDYRIVRRNVRNKVPVLGNEGGAGIRLDQLVWDNIGFFGSVVIGFDADDAVEWTYSAGAGDCGDHEDDESQERKAYGLFAFLFKFCQK